MWQIVRTVALGAVVALLGALPARAVTIGPQVPLAAFRSFTLEGDVAAAGTGMRNVGGGTITLGLPDGASIVRAYLYWAIIAPEQPAATGMLNGQAIAGTLIAQAGDACWPTFNAASADPPTIFTWVYRADVSSRVVDGDNVLAGFPSGLTGGQNPLSPSANASAFPLLDGATLVVVHTDAAGPTRTIVLYDGGETFFDDVGTVTMSLGAMPAIAPVEASAVYVVADGQSFFEGDGAELNGEPVAGPGAALRPTDAFDGTDGGGPAAPHGLWDTLEVDVSAVVSAGATEATASVISEDEGDCLTWVAQVMSVVVAPPATTTSTTTSVTSTSVASTTSTSNPSSTTSTSTSTSSSSSTTSTSTSTSSSSTSTSTSTSTSSSSTSSSTTSTSSSTSTSLPGATSTTSTSSSTSSTSLAPSSTTTTSTSSTTSTTQPSTCEEGTGFASIICRVDLLHAEVLASEGDRGIGRHLLRFLSKAREAAVEAQEAGEGEQSRRVLTRLRKVERRLIGFAHRVRSLAGARLIAHPDPASLLRAADALRADVLALRESFR